MSKRTPDVVALNPAIVLEQTKAVSELFGEQPEDVISPILSASEALCWVREIVLTIECDAADAGRNGGRIKRLAGAAAYIAGEFSNFAGCEYERLIDRLQVAGVVDCPASGEGEK